MPSYKKAMTARRAFLLAKQFIHELPVDAIIAGSLRRGEDEVGDIDIVSIGTFPTEVEGAEFVSGKNVMRTYLFHGVQINVMIAHPDAVGAMLLYATGSGSFGAMLRVKAKRKGFKLNRYGLFDRETDELVAADSEAAIFEALDKRYYEPHERVR
jgi:DNA polymerase (family 10)